MDSYDPIHAFNIFDITAQNASLQPSDRAGAADIDGILYNHSFRQLIIFINALQVRGPTTKFTFLAADAATLHTLIPQIRDIPHKFDIIDVSNLTDAANQTGSFLGVFRTLSTIANPLLKPAGVLIGLFMNYIGNVDLNMCYGRESDQEKASEMMVRYFGKDILRDLYGSDPRGAGMVRSIDMMSYFRDFEALWRLYDEFEGVREDMTRERFKVRKEVCRYRLDLGVARNRKQVVEEIAMMAMGGMSGWERYCVFERI